MKPIRTLLALSAVLLVSCSSTRYVTVATGSREINERALDEQSRVCLRDSATGRILGPFDAINLRVGVDSTTWFDEKSLAPRSAATSRVVSVEFSRSGATQGLTIGLLGGALVGAGVGFMDGDDRPLYRPNNGFEALLTFPALFIPRFTAGEKAVIYGSAFGLAGGLGGVIMGAFVERHERYELQQGSKPRSTPGSETRPLP